jgi:hypothetical protein
MARSHEPPPELRLPALILSALPVGDPVGAIHEVLIERHRKLRCQLEAPQGIAADVVMHWNERGQRLELRQNTQDAPRQHRRIELRPLRDLPQHCAVKCPRIRIGKRKLYIRAHAAMIRELERKPARNTAALHYHEFTRKRRSERLARERRKFLGERLEAVAVVDREHQ